MKNITLIFIGFLLLNCQQKNMVSKDLIRQLSSIENTKNNYIEPILFNILFVKLDNGKYLKTNGQELYEIYIKNYRTKYKDFYNFLDKVLNQESTIESKITSMNEFQLNSNILEKSITEIAKIYSIKNDNGIYILTANHKEDLNSILYCFFEKGYEINFDDYSGVFIIKK
ncbi:MULTISPECIES: hypothetical protein [Chryseobacterium]|uniref:Lipoprotein n=1 Tax=Chryseobacterium camelliae TaxID=1265445 RepID=A0ABU0TCW0_9FLAO|nr:MULTISPECIES: hypothetical protein [Chryseobacterium]MDT3407290.1 hypothetical protein [Pseudacidovorax intermedius]MDQ1094920.1 hypothetical protein [Chryseobacterium camelliae]MDQ1098860.1 hypothetical protein [Chryseobacterium sp. SORGH_AS_1048]MDR6086210.1 hypothetical protein [Chryseobacterium sp. SORGH_AS_0909]MDR6130579.1 hypothetical protein [Chryseobacterium sp. SORGH_AS_1175]